MPSEQDIQETRFERLDHAIARDIERRRRSLKRSWFLVIGAVLLAVLAFLKGPSPRDVAEKTAEQTAREFAGSGEFVAELSANPEFGRVVDESASERWTAYASGPEFRALVQDAAAEGVREPLSAFDAELESLRVDLTRTEDAQTELARGLERQRAGTEKLSAQLAELSSRLEEVGAQLEETRETLRQLAAQRQQSQLTPRSFLLKEDQSNPLPGLGLAIRLGPRNREGVEAVKVWKESVQLYPTGDDSASGAVLRFGEVFEFADGQGNRYVATLTNAQQRFLARDFVGLDVVVLSPGQPIPESGPHEGSP